jgi:O-antigen/teichoic acid export membrane protein
MENEFAIINSERVRIGGTARRLFKNIFYLTTSEIFWRILSFIAVIYLARILSVSGFGKIAFAQMVVTIYFIVITDFGLRTLGVRNIARDKSRLNDFLTNIIAMRFILSFLSFGLLCLLVFSINKDRVTKLLLILYGLDIFASVFLIDWVFQGLEQMKCIGISKVLNKFMYLVLILLFIKGVKDILFIPVFWFIGTSVAAIYLLYKYKKQNRIILKVDVKSWPTVFMTALPMGFSFIMLSVFHSFDTVMLGIMKTNEYVGWYSAADRIILVLLGFTIILSRAIFPVLSRYYKISKERLESFIKSSHKYLAAIAFPLGIGGCILARPILELFFGSKYMNSVIVFQILIWTVVISILRLVYAESALACDKQKDYMKGVLIGVSINIILNLLLIPKFDIKGAAFATVVSDAVFLVYMVKTFNLFDKRFIFSYMYKPVLASVFMGTVLFWHRNTNLFLSMFSGVFIYFSILFLFRYFSFGDIWNLGSKLQDIRKEV